MSADKLFVQPGEVNTVCSAKVSYRRVLARLDDPDGSIVLLEQQRDLSLEHGFS